MEIGTVIEFDEMEQILVRAVGQARYDNAKRHNLQESRPNIMDPFLADFEGFAGEMAFCKMANIYPDFEIGFNRAKNDKGDCTYCGYSIDIKTSMKDTQKLIVKPWKKGKVDVFAMITGKFPTYTFRGFYPSFMVFDDKNLKEMFGNNNYVIEQDKLMQLDELFEVMRAEAERFITINHRALEGVW